MRWTGLLTLGVAASVLTACGGGSSGGAPQPKGTASATPSASSSPPASGATAEAGAALLALSDLPKGWTSKPAPDLSNTALNTRLARCLHVSPGLVGGAGDDGVKANSPVFTPPNAATATTSEDIHIESPDKVAAGFAALSSSRLPQCFDTVAGAYFKTQATSGTRYGKLTSARLKFPHLGEKSAAFGFRIPVFQGTVRTDIYDNLVFIRQGNAIVELTYQKFGASFDEATAVSVARIAAAKLSAANIPA